MISTQDYKVNRLVWFQLESLEGDERAEVEAVLKSPSTFAEIAERPGAVRELSTMSGPAYLLKITPTFCMVFRKLGGTVEVADLLAQETVDYLSSLGSRKSSGDASHRPPSNSNVG